MKSTSDLVAVPTPLPIGSADQREAAFIKLLATAIAAYLTDEEHSEAGEANPLFEGAST